MKAADQLWIVFRHYHGGYDATPSNENGYDLLTSGYASASASYVDMLIIAMGRLLPAIDMDMLIPELPMVDMPLCYGYVLTGTSKVDMFTTAMGMDMLLLNTDMDRPLPEHPTVDMLLLTTTMDIPLSTTDSSTMDGPGYKHPTPRTVLSF